MPPLLTLPVPSTTTHRPCSSGSQRWALGAGALLLACTQPALAQVLPTVDLPACELSSPGQRTGLSVGLVLPGASDHLLAYAARLTQSDPSLNICAESWASVLPRWVPWASELERGHGWLLLVLAFVLVVTLLWRFTPRHWWQRTTLLGLLGVGAGTWLASVGLMAAFHGLGGQGLLYDNVVSLRVPQQASPLWLNLKGPRELEAQLAQLGLAPQLTPPTAPKPLAAVPDATNTGAPAGSSTTTPAPAAGPNVSLAPTGAVANTLQPPGRYRVAHRLNLREGPGVQHRLQHTLPRGEVVEFDGQVQGDWWHLRTATGEQGWSSSLWLRRLDESVPPANPRGEAARP